MRTLRVATTTCVALYVAATVGVAVFVICHPFPDLDW